MVGLIRPPSIKRRDFLVMVTVSEILYWYVIVSEIGFFIICLEVSLMMKNIE